MADLAVADRLRRCEARLALLEDWQQMHDRPQVRRQSRLVSMWGEWDADQRLRAVYFTVIMVASVVGAFGQRRGR